MEKELKIAELAKLWGCSVPTTWNRINKEGLITFKKKDENNKEINYVRISEEFINQFILNNVNNVYKDVNNGYYEDMLNVNNVNKDFNNVNNNVYDAEIINENNDFNKNVFDRLKTVYEDYNNEVKNLYNEISEYKAKQLLLEDKASREGFYINENNELKKVINNKDNVIKCLLTIIIIFIMCSLTLITYFITVNNVSNTESNFTFSEAIQEEINK